MGILWFRSGAFLGAGYLVINLATSMRDPLNTIAELFAGFTYGTAEAFGGESVWIDVNVESIVVAGTACL